MRGWSLPVGRFLGVDVRIHLTFLFLLGLSVTYGPTLGGTSGRGIALWLMLVLAVAVREVSRAFAAAWWGLQIRTLLLLPTGAMVTYAPGEATDLANTVGMQRRMAWVGPAANLLLGLVLGAIVIAVTPRVNLMGEPLITPAYLLRSLIWTNLLLGLLHLLPSLPLDAGRVFQAEMIKAKGVMKGVRAAAAMSQLVAFLLMVRGLYTNDFWLASMGGFVLLGFHMEDQGHLPNSESDLVKMRDVMLTEYSTLSASDTLEDALQRSVHVLQDVFPVVRGVSMVGSVSRQSIVDALATGGNGYVQGVMTRSFQSAHPDDALVKTLRRVMAGRGAQLLPVLEGERVVGIITPQNLSQSIGMLNHTRKLRPTN